MCPAYLGLVSRKEAVFLENCRIGHRHVCSTGQDIYYHYRDARLYAITNKNPILYQSYRTLLSRSGHPGTNLNLYCTSPSMRGGWLNINAYEIDTDWTDESVTWQTQPVLGDLLDSVLVDSTGWKVWNVGVAKGICLKVITEFTECGASEYVNAIYASDRHPNPALHPYFSG